MELKRWRVVTVAGARPNFMKIAPIQRELAKRSDCFAARLVHTGQHYDVGLSQVFFDELEIDSPDVTLDVGSRSHAQQTAAIMAGFESVLLDWPADLVVVVGDVNSTLACALVAAKMGIAVAHVEAGLRSFDRSMPEEINRVLTDHLADFLFTTERSAHENLHREGIAAERVHFVGNVMIDTLLAHRERARSFAAPARHGVARGQYVLLTLHRPNNVDDPEMFEQLMGAISEIACDVPVLFPGPSANTTLSSALRMCDCARVEVAAPTPRATRLPRVHRVDGGKRGCAHRFGRSTRGKLPHWVFRA